MTQRPTRRLLLTVFALLAFSLAITVAVAWSCLACGDLQGLYGRDARPPNAVPGGTGWLAPEHVDWPAPVPTEWGSARSIVRSTSFGLQWRGGVTSLGITPPFSGVQVVEAGWPFKALRWTQWFTSSGGRAVATTKVRGQGPQLPRSTIPGLPGSLTGFGWAAGFVPRRLPLDLIWPGFLGNTAIAAGTILLVVGVTAKLFSAARRARRIARSACPACGYDLTGTADGPCPECGAPAAIPGRHDAA